MIDVHDSDAESVERMQKWWSENGKTTVAGLVLGLGSVFGWSGWQGYQEQRAEAASALYQQVSQSAAENKPEEVRRHGETLMGEFPDSGYAALTALFLAKAAMNDNQTDEAVGHLQWVLNNAHLNELKLVARLRLARLALDKGNADEAWNLVNAVAPGKFENAYTFVKGDVLLAQNKPKEAREAYTKALELYSVGDPEYRLVELKLNDLGTVNVPATSGS